MSLLAKILVVIQAILVMVYLGLTASLYQHRRDWRTSYQKLKLRYSQSVSRAQQEIDALRTFVRAKDEVVGAKEQEVRQLKTQLDDALRTAQSYQKHFRDEREKNQRQQENFNQLNGRLTTALRNNEQLNSRNEELDTLLDTATKRREIAEGQVARLTNLTTELESDLGTLRETFADTRKRLRDKELLISMAQSRGFDFATLAVPGPPVPAIDGTVTAIKDDISPALVLLSVGSDDRVEQGFHFSIYRNDVFVGKVVVERVLPDSAGCRVLFTADGQAIAQGDSAATRLQ